VDKQTIKKIKSGDIKTFEKQFRLLYPPLCGYANKILNNKDNAEEVVQEVFFNLWKNKKKLNIEKSLKSYLYKSVFNKCIHQIEHKKVKDKYLGTLKPDLHLDSDIEKAIISGELYIIYKNTLEKLPERCRKIFKMSRNYGLKYSEIATKLSISVKTVEASITKSLKILRYNFEQYQSGKI
jgi:RNA polymerase sigma-70 factor (ECF subfamily)